eukprot:120704-Amphidinium_carterae.1
MDHGQGTALGFGSGAHEGRVPYSLCVFAYKLKELRINAGRSWDDRLATELSKAKRASARSQGPAQQSQPLPLEEVCALPGVDKALCQGGPCGGWRFLVLGPQLGPARLHVYATGDRDGSG